VGLFRPVMGQLYLFTVQEASDSVKSSAGTQRLQQNKTCDTTVGGFRCSFLMDVTFIDTIDTMKIHCVKKIEFFL
jgi:hypothetical protein